MRVPMVRATHNGRKIQITLFVLKKAAKYIDALKKILYRIPGDIVVYCVHSLQKMLFLFLVNKLKLGERLQHFPNKRYICNCNRLMTPLIQRLVVNAYAVINEIDMPLFCIILALKKLLSRLNIELSTCFVKEKK